MQRTLESDIQFERVHREAPIRMNGVESYAPMFRPEISTATSPDVGEFLAETESMNGKSNEKTVDCDAFCRANVTVTPRFRPEPAADLHSK